MGKKILKNMDWGILVCIVILLAIGLVALFSATQGTEYEEFKKMAALRDRGGFFDGNGLWGRCGR